MGPTSLSLLGDGRSEGVGFPAEKHPRLSFFDHQPMPLFVGGRSVATGAKSDVSYVLHPFWMERASPPTNEAMRREIQRPRRRRRTIDDSLWLSERTPREAEAVEEVQK